MHRRRRFRFTTGPIRFISIPMRFTSGPIRFINEGTKGGAVK